jgi:hypothetical protein
MTTGIAAWAVEAEFDWSTAMMVNVPGSAGAVYVPSDAMAPPLGCTTDQFTATGVASFSSATNFRVLPVLRGVVGPGPSMVIEGGGGGTI